MEKPADFLSQHFTIPHVREVTPQRPLDWLARGWGDLRDNLGSSVCYGIVFAVVGYVLLALTAQRPHLFSTAISGFVLIGPLAAAGIYEISRRYEMGEKPSFMASLTGLWRRADVLCYFGILLALTVLVWERFSALVFAMFYTGDVPDLAHFFEHILFSGEYTALLATYVLVGGTLAAVVYSVTVVSIPMIIARETDMLTAMATSVRVVATNPLPMLVWALLIALLIVASFATLMVGLVILLPVLGHAAWHAYRDMVA